MDKLIRYSNALVAKTSMSFVRYLFHEIAWSYRFIGITGARGIGKTTLMLQYLKKNYENSAKAVYVSLDHIYFQKNALFDFAEEFYTHGGEIIFIDEVHRYPGWSIELKNIYDTFPLLKIVFSGSSALQIHRAEADLSRRVALYNLSSMSLREYINFHKKLDLKPYSLNRILQNHVEDSLQIADKIKPVALLKEYMYGGPYPFFVPGSALFEQQLMRTVNVIIETDLLAIERYSYSTLIKLRRILALISDSVPFKPNISELSRKAGISRDILLKLLDQLEKSELLISLKQHSHPTGYLTKPLKIYLNNTTLIYCLSEKQIPEAGTLRETFFANQLKYLHQINISKEADFLIDGKYTFEIGGKNKTSEQLIGIKDAFVVRDDIESGSRNVIPLWMFGFLY